MSAVAGCLLVTMDDEGSLKGGSVVSDGCELVVGKLIPLPYVSSSSLD